MYVAPQRSASPRKQLSWLLSMQPPIVRHSQYYDVSFPHLFCDSHAALSSTAPKIIYALWGRVKLWKKWTPELFHIKTRTYASQFNRSLSLTHSQRQKALANFYLDPYIALRNFSQVRTMCQESLFNSTHCFPYYPLSASRSNLLLRYNVLGSHFSYPASSIGNIGATNK